MSIIKTQKHEMEYNTETRQIIFNGRNYTSASSTGGIPPRMIVAAKTEEEGWTIDGVTYKHRIDGVNNNFEAYHWYDLDGNDLGTNYESSFIPCIFANYIKSEIYVISEEPGSNKRIVHIYSTSPYQPLPSTAIIPIDGDSEEQYNNHHNTLSGEYFTAAYFDKTTNDGGILYFNLVSD